MLIVDLSLLTDKPKNENCEGNLGTHAGHEIATRERTTVQRTAKKVDDKCEKAQTASVLNSRLLVFSQ